MIWPELSGCRIQRIDMPAADVLCLELHSKDLQGHLVAVLQGDVHGIGLCEARPRGLAAGAIVQRLRKLIGGARLLAIEAVTPSCLRLRCGRGDDSALLYLEFGRKRGNAVLIGDADRTLARLHPSTDPYVPAAGPPVNWPPSLQALRESGPALLDRQRHTAVDDGRQALRHALQRRRGQLVRRLTAIEADAARAARAPAMRARANALLSQLHRLRGNETEVTLELPTAEGVEKVVEALPGGVGPQTHAEQLFKLARRLERGAVHARDRTKLTEDAIEGLDALLRALEAADATKQIESLRERARALGVGMRTSGKSTAREPAARVPYREYIVSGGLSVLVGRGASDNDALTTKVARPHDLFLHARDTPGAHVIVRLPRGKACPSEALVDAASLAAYFSDARGEQIVDVLYVEKRHVRKPRGAAPGAVTLQREKVMRLRADPDRVARLLRSVRA